MRFRLVMPGGMSPYAVDEAQLPVFVSSHRAPVALCPAIPMDVPAVGATGR